MLQFSPNGKLLAFDNAISGIEVWEITEQGISTKLNMKNLKVQNTQGLTCLTFSPDSGMLAHKHRSHIDIYRVGPDGMEFNKRFIPNGSLGTSDILVFSPNGKMLLDVNWMGNGNDIQIWDLDSENLLGTFRVQSKPIQKLVFSHDGKNPCL